MVNSGKNVPQLCCLNYGYLSGKEMYDGVTLSVLGVQHPQGGAGVLAQVVNNLKQKR